MAATAARVGRTTAPGHGQARLSSGRRDPSSTTAGHAATPRRQARRQRRERSGSPRPCHRGVEEERRRRGKADRRGSIEAPSNGGSIDTHLTAGDGRRKSAKAAATRESPELRGVRVSACARGRGRVRPTEPDERLGLGLTAGPH